MITFLGGPAAGLGQALLIRRAPRYLRVVWHPRKGWDALDQLQDTPDPEETIFAYELVSLDGWMHVCSRGRGRRGGRCAMATYRYVVTQPTDDTMRNGSTWRAWAREQLWARAAESSNASPG